MTNDEDNFNRAFIDLSAVIMGDYVTRNIINNRQKTKNAVDEILKFYKISIAPIPDSIEGIDEYLDFALRPTGIMKRRVRLTKGWQKDAAGPMLGELKSGEVVALLPLPFSGYTIFDYESGKKRRVTKQTAALLGDEAYCFYKPFPMREFGMTELLKYMLSLITVSDMVLLLGITGLITLFGFFSPIINKLMFKTVIPGGNSSYILPVVLLLISFGVATMILSISKSFVAQRLSTRIGVAIQPAAMGRVLALPASFFKAYNAGDLASRLAALNKLCTTLVSTFTGTFLSALFSLVYLFQIRLFSGELLYLALVITLMMVILNIAVAILSLKLTRKSMKNSAKLSGLVFSLFTGQTKIKLTGSEKRSFSKWAALYKEGATLSYNPPGLLKYGSAVNQALGSLGVLGAYVIAFKTGVTTGDYMAFNMAYGMFSAGIMALASMATTFANIKPTLEMALPILQACPEVSTNKTVVESLSGGIEINNVCFRYDPAGEDILSDISLKIRPNQYIAIVGKTGCGKSTLLRLLLGFEKPYKGAVYYDGIDINKLDLRSLRRKIGTVTQNGKLFTGDIYSNIVISAPHLSLDDAWEAARLAGLERDIKDMPMGMHTVISEGGGGVSGGQKQRLMIARAIAPKPKIIMFDEATSALDNITQKIVSDSLSALKCTRFVIAHRLSTIRECDRIIVLDKGRIIEDGTYDKLLDKKGFFFELVSRQLIDDDTKVGKTTVF